MNDPSAIDLAQRHLAASGVELVLSDLAQRDGRWHSGTAQERAADLQAALLDPEVDAVMCLRGGYGCSDLLSHLDLAAVARVPKPFIGFSDATAIHAALLRSGMVSFYGPTVGRFASTQPDPLTSSRLIDLLRSDGVGEVPWAPSDREPEALAGGRASGTLVGGWLTGLVHALGTRWAPDPGGCVLLLEDVSRPPHDIDRMFVQLEQTGWLGSVAGIVVAECADCEATDHEDALLGRTLRDVLEARLGNLGVPVLYDVPIGHGTSLSTVPLGVRVTLDADAAILSVDEPALV